MGSNLIVICEGEAHTIEYLTKNGVIPHKVIFDTVGFRDITPYLTNADEILVIIVGLTQFTMAELYLLFKDLEENKDRVKSITIMSNIKLGNIRLPYYFYKGDLFYGSVVKIEDGKEIPVEDVSEGSKKSSKKKDKDKKEKSVDNQCKNTVMWAFKKYNKKDVRVQIHGRKPSPVGRNFELEKLRKKVVDVDLFK